MTRDLIEAIKAEGIEGKSLLDIGGGIGAIQHELLKAGVAGSVAVDASTACVQALQQEAQRQGHEERIRVHHGDFVDIADYVQQADIVTLDRVICCYHDLESLVRLSSERAAVLYGLVYPRATWPAMIAVVLFNLYLRLRRNPFRVFLHPRSTVDRMLRHSGFQQRFYKKNLLWQVVLYQR